MAVTTIDGAAITWEELFDDFSPALVSYARSKGIRAAEDLVQDVLVTALEKLSEFDGDRASLRSWLFTITYRRIADEHRRFYRRPEVLVAEHPPVADAADEVSEVVTQDSSASEAFAALEILGSRERAVLEMRIIDEAAPAEVGAALGISAGNVRVIQARALVKVRKYLTSRDTVPSFAMLFAFIRYLRSRLPDDGKVGSWIDQTRLDAVAGNFPITDPAAKGAAVAALATTTTGTSAGFMGAGAAKLGLVVSLAAAPLMVGGDVAVQPRVPESDEVVVAGTSDEVPIHSEGPADPAAIPVAPTTGPADVPRGNDETSPPADNETSPPPDNETDGNPSSPDEGQSGERTSDAPPEPDQQGETPESDPAGPTEPTGGDDGPLEETTGLVEEAVDTVTDDVVEPLVEETLDTVEKTVDTVVDDVVEPVVEETVDTVEETVDTVEETVDTVEETVDTVQETTDTVTNEVVDPVVDEVGETTGSVVDDVVNPLVDGLLGENGGGGLLGG